MNTLMLSNREYLYTYDTSINRIMACIIANCILWEILNRMMQGIKTIITFDLYKGESHKCVPTYVAQYTV